jgi:hypothetical protein
LWVNLCDRELKRWIAYTSNLTGRNEIYVQPFPSGSGRYQISNSGGDWPRWRRNGKELFYHSLENVNGPAGVPISPLLSATVSAHGETLEPGSPKEIVVFPLINLPHSGGDYHGYAVSADGQRILVNQVSLTSLLKLVTTGPAATVGPDPGANLTVALNWAASLRK